MKVKAKEKHIFVRNHDNFRMGNEIHLGYDFSTGVKRKDKIEYYHEEPMTEDEWKELKTELDNNLNN